MSTGKPRLSADEIAKKVQELTKGSAFDRRKEEKRRHLEARVAEMKRKLAATPPAERERIQAQVDKAIADAEHGRIMSKVMVHIDMDAFYASVEIRDRPELADKPVAVGSNSMLSTCNYVARSYGARSAMPGFVARKICPDLVILPHDFRKYHAVAKQVQDIFSEYCPDFVSGGLDEAYLDLTEYLQARIMGQTTNGVFDFTVPESIASRTGCNCSETECEENETGNAFSQQSQQITEKTAYCRRCKLLKCKVGDKISFGDTAWCVVEEIRFKILMKTMLTSSAGIAPNTMIAKIASDLRKPNGQFMLEPTISSVLKFMTNCAVAKVPGVGPVCQGELHGLGIVTCGDLKERLCDVYQVFTELNFGFFLHAALGMGSTELEHGGPRKSIGTETTFDKTSDVKRLLEIIQELCVEVAESLQEKQLCGRTLTMKLKTADFRVLTRAGSCKKFFLPSNNGTDLFQTAKALLEKEIAENNGHLCVRLLGIRLSNLKDLDDLPDASENSIAALLGRKRKSGDERGLKTGKRTASNEADEDNDVEQICLFDDENSVASSCFTEHTSPTTSGAGPSDTSDVTSYSCPVCNFTFPRTTLVKFNNHIDECLNRSTIRAMKEEDKLLVTGDSNFNTSNFPSTSKSASNPREKNAGGKSGAKKSPTKSGQNSILNFLKPRTQ